MMRHRGAGSKRRPAEAGRPISAFAVVLWTGLGLDVDPEGGGLGRLDGRAGLDQSGLPVSVALCPCEAAFLARRGLLGLAALALTLPEAVRHASTIRGFAGVSRERPGSASGPRRRAPLDARARAERGVLRGLNA